MAQLDYLQMTQLSSMAALPARAVAVVVAAGLVPPGWVTAVPSRRTSALVVAS